MMWYLHPAGGGIMQPQGGDDGRDCKKRSDFA